MGCNRAASGTSGKNSKMRRLTAAASRVIPASTVSETSCSCKSCQVRVDSRFSVMRLAKKVAEEYEELEPAQRASLALEKLDEFKLLFHKKMFDCEEKLMHLHNLNRNLVFEKQDSESKLREELENVKVLMNAMTMPLWQFGDYCSTERNLVQRMVNHD